MFIVTEADAAAIRDIFNREGELSAAIELRRRFPGVTDNAKAREFVRTIAGWAPPPAPASVVQTLPRDPDPEGQPAHPYLTAPDDRWQQHASIAGNDWKWPDVRWPLGESASQLRELLPDLIAGVTTVHCFRHANGVPGKLVICDQTIEQDHRCVKRLTRPGRGFGSFRTARRALAGFEAVVMIRKGQARNIGGDDIRARVTLIARVFQLTA